MGIIAQAQEAMTAYEHRAPNPPYRLKFSNCRRKQNRVSCSVLEEWDYINAVDGSTVTLDFIVKLRAVKTKRGWKVSELQ